MAMAAPAISTLSLHDALPISAGRRCRALRAGRRRVHAPRQRVLARARRGRRLAPGEVSGRDLAGGRAPIRSEEHTSELQSLTNLVCRLLLEKKKILTHPLTTG